jgi:simple sugar transport system ATP-binding protein
MSAMPAAALRDEPEPAQIPLIEMQGISKAFGAIQALTKVNLRLMPGEILGLVGDNAAGKSTLMKILSGAYAMDEGRILLQGEEAHFASPHDSRKRGIEMIYQDFALCGNMDVASNMFLGNWPTRGWFVDKKGMEAEAWQILRRLNVDIASVNLRVESLSGGRQQLVAIARAVSFDPKVVILDEPTANLSVPVARRLLDLMRDLKSHNVAQIIISHRLQDVFEVGDRVMVLKRGRHVGERYINKTTEDEILGLIVQGDAGLTEPEPA